MPAASRTMKTRAAGLPFVGCAYRRLVMKTAAVDHSKMNVRSRIDFDSEWRARDLAVLWHPCTQMHDHTRGDADAVPLLTIARGDGVWLYDHAGRRYLDAISSWWTNLFGHANRRIGAALKDQLDRLEHV